MKIGFYNPYLDALGGGERYTLTIASHWSKEHEVSLFWDYDTIRKDATERLNIDLSRVKTTQNIFRVKKLFKKLVKSSRYDLIFFLSDGSIPLSLAKRNILHFQNPFPLVNGRSPLNIFKLSRFKTVVCNSRFTKHYIDEEFGANSTVIYPPVTIGEFEPKNKKKVIVSVGRFSTHHTNKRQKEMVEFFRNMVTRNKDWKLYLVGGLLETDRPYFEEVKKLGAGLPVYLLPNEPFANLKNIYSEAAIYWHAAGYNVDSQKDPAGLEHFGISVVEAMAAGCIPIVFNGGGLPEIVHDNVHGFLWYKGEELIKKTQAVIEDKKLQLRLQKESIKRSRDFDEARFIKSFDSILTSFSK